MENLLAKMRNFDASQEIKKSSANLETEKIKNSSPIKRTQKLEGSSNFMARCVGFTQFFYRNHRPRFQNFVNQANLAIKFEYSS